MSSKNELEEKRKQLIKLYHKNNKDLLNQKLINHSQKLDKQIIKSFKEQLNKE